jgi:hypothetical protein
MLVAFPRQEGTAVSYPIAGGFMKQHLRRSETPSNLSPSSQRRLASYALAAGAAGVGVLASAGQLQAEIVYTPTQTKIHQNGQTFGFQLDLNGDGITDFELANWVFGAEGWNLVHGAVTGNHVVGSGIYAFALAPGANIGPAGPFAHPPRSAEATSMARWSDFSNFLSSHGPWKNTRNRYLGFKFLINGAVHFGWARLSVDTDTMLLTGYAYETVANKAIVAGQTSGSDQATSATPAPPVTGATLGRLAQGAAGLFAWRRDPA